MKSIEKLKIIASGELCNRCGTCVGLSNGRIAFGDKTKKYLPLIPDDLEDNVADRIIAGCSGGGIDFNGYRERIYPAKNNFHSYIGSYKKISIAHAKNAEIRKNGASGGILSAILIHLLDSGQIDGVVTTKMSESEPWLTETFIATTKEEILLSAQSKYILTSVNEILPQIAVFRGNLAYVGLPGQIQSIRMLQAAGDNSVNAIKFIFGPFYGNTLHFSSVKSFLRSFKVKDYKKIRKLYFRHGEWPGNMRIELEDQRIFELKKFHANYLIPFHIVPNSLYCIDFTNEFADISGGDAWAPIYEQRGLGYSTAIIRSEAGLKIWNEMIQGGWIDTQDISEEEAIKMHSHGYDFKKRGAFIRMKFRRWVGKPIPEYHLQFPGFPFSRYLMEFIISAMFLILCTSIMRWIVEKLPSKMVGKIFEHARIFWKKSTFAIKRNQL